ncbi:hypothetical protein ETAA8_66060 [Anatilimnocola aggregata]|uniref:Uncharacterized protein n=2 Tax=Anatilimnocola aggregata TaxID=2528021 RepID=A0A517YMJ4_9BACT|nr:hypothetical protein ETAA8_66060 [Anatilimnocola aggregata]
MPPNVPAAPQPIASTPVNKPPYTIEPIVVGEAVSADEAFQKFVAHYGQNRVIRLVLQFADGDAPPQTGDWLKASLRQLTPPGIPQSVHVSRQGARATAIVGPARPLASLHGSFKWNANAVLDYPSRTVTVPM